jgi:glycosyltransferase involved in cell wall biosynthesis
MATLHILSAPDKPVHIDNRIDAFAVAVVKFVENMKKYGWDCVHYGIPGCQVDCETVICLPYVYNDYHTALAEYNKNAAEEIKKRKKSGDLIMCFHGWGNQEAAEANNDLPIVEPYIAYDHSAVFAPFRVFVSYATMHMFYGHHKMLMNPSWFDAVITNGFTPSEFEFKTEKENFVLYFGRVIESKGINVAIQATELSGDNLLIAGPGSLADLGYKETPPHVTCLGLCDAEQRKKLMSNAKAIIGPTYYVEPFGNMVVEGYLSGTPSITTDWGGFTETVVNGVTGYRCREMREFVYALKNIDKIDPYVCRKYAEENYSEEAVYKKYHEYFLKIQQQDFYRT